MVDSVEDDRFLCSNEMVILAIDYTPRNLSEELYFLILQMNPISNTQVI